jgi:ArsR family transcriptional regulator, arsenate/arsenite/antimonite-responsive transcriptional repressor
MSTSVDETPRGDAAGEETAGLVTKLFGDPLRARIVRLLAEEQLCTCHLVELTGARQPTVSHHLKVLREAGLVEALPDGRFTYYRLLEEPLASAAEQLAALSASASAAPRHRRPCD